MVSQKRGSPVARARRSRQSASATCATAVKRVGSVPMRRRMVSRTMSLSSGTEESQLERPPDYADYHPPRTTAEGGTTMLLSGVFLAGAVVTLGLAIYKKLADVRTFGQIGNLLVFAVALLLIAIYLLVWEIALRLISRSED